MVQYQSFKKSIINYNLITNFTLNLRPPKGTSKPDPVISDEDEEDDAELIEAKIVLRDVSTSGK